MDLSIGILAWKSGQTLINTLNTYKNHGLLELTDDITIFFQEGTELDAQIAEYFNVSYVLCPENLGIGRGFIELAKMAKYQQILLLEHDWHLIEDKYTTTSRLTTGINLLKTTFQCVRYRHRKYPGYPHFSFKYKGRELSYYDLEIECTSPHLLDAIHWTDDPEVQFAPYIKYDPPTQHYVAKSRYANWTNNPCMYNRDFYIEKVTPFVGGGIDLEGNISKWWANQNFNVAHGEGLFTHKDPRKYGQ